VDCYKKFSELFLVHFLIKFKTNPNIITQYKLIFPFSIIIKQVPTYAMQEKQTEKNQNWVASQEALF